MTEDAQWVKAILEGDRRTVGRVLTRIENEREFARSFMPELFKVWKRKPRIGFTGSPGVGKSTLIDALVRELRKQEKIVGIIAVDPTSPYTGGAMLGDRVRMIDHYLDEGVFIRSMASRGSLGGLASATTNFVRVLETAGFDTIFIETVGAGQTGADIIKAADTVCLLMTPDYGDGIQTMKAGIMEMADIYVINKADRPGADQLEEALRVIVDLIQDPNAWHPRIIQTESLNGTGITQLIDVIEEHRKFLCEDNRFERLLTAQTEAEITFIIEGYVKETISNLKPGTDKGRVKGARGEKKGSGDLLRELAERVVSGEIDPYGAADLLRAKIKDSLGK